MASCHALMPLFLKETARINYQGDSSAPLGNYTLVHTPISQHFAG